MKSLIGYCIATLPLIILPILIIFGYRDIVIKYLPLSVFIMWIGVGLMIL